MEYLDTLVAERPPSGKIVVFGEVFLVTPDRPETLEALRRRLARVIWCTYRRGFPRIGDTAYQSDSGWGCMLRCGQMILAEALLRARDYPAVDADAGRASIVSLISDAPECPFSIHQIALRGAIVDKPVGAWFGPNAAAQVIRSLVSEQPGAGLAVHVAMDGCLATKDVEDTICPGGKWSRPLLLFVPLRLGLHALNAEYFPSIRAMLQMPESVGAIGGRPNAAHFFIGTQDDDLIFLDPHTTQPAGLPAATLHTYTCLQPCRMRVAAVDPSLCLGFLVRDLAAWHTLLLRFGPVAPKLFDVLERAPVIDEDAHDDFVVSDPEDDGFAIVS
eukprot:m.14036 g.14036  ORF g.14036 m.14036 type:complete len:331 (+) comp6326_c0_seq1:34-1026(+)